MSACRNHIQSPCLLFVLTFHGLMTVYTRLARWLNFFLGTFTISVMSAICWLCNMCNPPLVLFIFLLLSKKIFNFPFSLLDHHTKCLIIKLWLVKKANKCSSFWGKDCFFFIGLIALFSRPCLHLRAQTN